MPEYTWNLPEEIQKIVDMMNRAKEQSEASPMQVQPAMQEIEQPRQQPVQQEQPPILNGLERQAAAGLINYKNAWGQADNADVQKAMGGLNADQIRDLSSKGADNLRQIANGAGMNLTGYGADVSLTDALRNLQSNDARARIEGLTTGQYGMTSDQKFDVEYYKLIADGYSPRRAKKIAGEAAQRYQADRVSYLQGMYHGYGRDGNYTNDFGVDIIGTLANENPMLANLYATVFPNPKDAQTRANTLEDKFIERNNALSLLNAGLQNDVVRYNVQGAVQDRNADSDWKRKLMTLGQESQNRILEYAARSGIDLNKFIEEEKLKQQWEKDKPSEVEAIRKQYFELFKAAGMSDEEATAATQEMLKQYAASLFTGNGRGGTGTGGRNGTGNDKTIDNMKKIIDGLVAQRKEYAAQLYTNNGLPNENLTPAQKADLENRIAQIDTQLEYYNGIAGNAFGLEKQEDPYKYEDYSEEDEAKNIQNIAKIIALGRQAKASDEQIFQNVKNWMPSDKTDWFARTLYNKALKLLR